MALPSGARLGPYEVLSPLGAGGMGEVYRARDTRLKRDIALKVLVGAVAEDSGRFRRFQSEAQSTAALSHPNIVTVYDIGQEHGAPYIVSELVSGGTLTTLLNRGPLPTKRLLDLAVAIAEGLAAAHAGGIVHRDLKPDNILLTADGSPKIADFGLAKYFRPSHDAESSQLMTLTDDRTKEGTIVGTVSYMSPEQAKGEAVDFRSDQFSFGSVLYEMATGKRAFRRQTAVQSLAAIVQEEPESIANINSQIPPPLRWIVEQCLAKEPKDRYTSTEDLARDLARVRDHISEVSGSGEAAPVMAHARRLRRLILIVLTLATVAAAGLLVGRRTLRIEPPTFQRLTFRRGNVHEARFASDGQTIVYSASWYPDKPEIFTTRIDSPEWRALGIRDATFLSLSSLGEIALLRYLGEGRGMTLSRVPLAGGAPRDVLDHAGGADWSPDGTRLAAVHYVGSRERLEYPIGKVLYEGTSIWDFRISPKGDRVAIADHPFEGNSGASVKVVDSGGKTKVILKREGVTGLAWSPDGREIWCSGGQGALFASTLSGKTRLLHQSAGRLYLLDVSRNGRVLVRLGHWRPGIAGRLAGQPDERDLSWMANSMLADISSDGTTILFYDGGRGEGWDGLGGFSGVYLRKAGESAVRLGAGHPLALSPDGQWALAVVEGNTQLALLPTGAGEARILGRDNLTYGFWARWLPDGRHVVVDAQEPGHARRCWVRDLEKSERRPVTPEGVSPSLVSADGRFVLAKAPPGKVLLYSVGGQETREVPFISKDEEPVQWSRDARYLYVVSEPSGRAMRVVRLDLTTGRREPWLEIKADPLSSLGSLLLTRDGSSYAYGYDTHFSDLYLVEGLK
jgi:hypothetical protein